MTTTHGRPPRPAALLLLVCLLLTGCVALPETGSVRTRPASNAGQQNEAPFDFTPSGPRPGASPVDIVEGFLLAMQASPLSTAVAREYLTHEGSAGWVPERGTLVHGGSTLAAEDDTVEVLLQETVRLDARGSWQGAAGGDGTVGFGLDLVREQGEWRISNPPDLLVVPRTHFETRFEQYFLYFFDPTAQILVPEPVYLPRGEQAPTLLVRRLLRGPDPELPGLTRSFLPAGTELELSVPVGRDGTAEVPLSRHVLDLNSKDQQMALAQIAWTVGQVAGVDAIRITVDGAPLDIPGEGDVQPVDAWTEFDPAIHWASQELFGIRRGRVVALAADAERRIEGAFDVGEVPLRSVGVDLPAEQAAAVTADGASVLLATRGRGSGGAAAGPEPVTLVSGAADLLRPAWDIHGQLWLVDAAAGGARLLVVRNGVAVPVEAPGISGEQVSAFTVSRDGTRLAAVLREPRGDRLVLARVVRDRDGRVRNIAQAAELPTGLPTGAQAVRIRDLGWRTPGSLALLAGRTPGSSELGVSLIDGSVPLEASTTAELLDRRGTALVVSPTVGMPLYVATPDGQLFELGSDGRWSGPRNEERLMAPTFVG